MPLPLNQRGEDMMIFTIICAAVALGATLTAYACCVVASEADRRAEEMRHERDNR